MSLICACCCVGVPINMLTRYVTFLFVFMFFRRAVVEWVRNFDCHTTGSGIPRRRGPNIGEKAAKSHNPAPQKRKKLASHPRSPVYPPSPGHQINRAYFPCPASNGLCCSAPDPGKNASQTALTPSAAVTSASILSAPSTLLGSPERPRQ